ncbi:hypothetical protein B0H19DRAFT_1063230 [Mycena capillaripes]|nr:hypothetical protein B0H19DRAFT_1063230 [Mycena capillaripes]
MEINEPPPLVNTFGPAVVATPIVDMDIDAATLATLFLHHAPASSGSRLKLLSAENPRVYPRGSTVLRRVENLNPYPNPADPRVQTRAWTRYPCGTLAPVSRRAHPQFLILGPVPPGQLLNRLHDLNLPCASSSRFSSLPSLASTSRDGLQQTEPMAQREDSPDDFLASLLSIVTPCLFQNTLSPLLGTSIEKNRKSSRGTLRGRYLRKSQLLFLRRRRKRHLLEAPVDDVPEVTPDIMGLYTYDQNMCWNIIQKKEVNRQVTFRTDASTQDSIVSDIERMAPVLTNLMKKWELNPNAKPSNAAEKRTLRTLNKLKLMAKDLKGSSGYKQCR